MYTFICEICKNKFYSANKKKSFYKKCFECKKEFEKKRDRFRTSTPISELENNIASSSSDSVNDFFYQSWKSGLLPNSTQDYQQPLKFKNFQSTSRQPFYYYTQVVYVNTILCQPIYPAVGVCTFSIGYRPDGTYGVLPVYWPYVTK